MFQNVKCESCLGVDKTDRKQTMSEKLHVMRESYAGTSLDAVMENPIAVNNDESVLTSHIPANIWCFHLFHLVLCLFFGSSHSHIFPGIPLGWARLSIVTQAHDKPLFKKR